MFNNGPVNPKVESIRETTLIREVKDGRHEFKEITLRIRLRHLALGVCIDIEALTCALLEGGKGKGFCGNTLSIDIVWKEGV